MNLDQTRQELTRQASDLTARAQQAEGREKLDLLTMAEGRRKYADALGALTKKEQAA